MRGLDHGGWTPAPAPAEAETQAAAGTDADAFAATLQAAEKDFASLGLGRYGRDGRDGLSYTLLPPLDQTSGWQPQYGAPMVPAPPPPGMEQGFVDAKAWRSDSLSDAAKPTLPWVNEDTYLDSIFGIGA